MRVYALYEHIHGDQVVPALGDYDVRVALAGLDVHLVHGLDRREVLVYHALQAAAAVAHVADYAPEYAHVGVRVDENLYVQELAEPRVLENQYALDDYDRRGVHEHRLVRAVVDGVVVDGAAHAAPGAQLPEVAHHALGVEGVGAVVVELRALLVRHVVVRLVVVVVIDNADVVGEALLQAARYRSLAAAGAARDADGHNLPHISSPLFDNFNTHARGMQFKNEKARRLTEISGI